MIENKNPAVRANYVVRYFDKSGDTGEGHRFSADVIAWDDEGYALIPGSKGKLIRAVDFGGKTAELTRVSNGVKHGGWFDKNVLPTPLT